MSACLTIASTFINVRLLYSVQSRRQRAHCENPDERLIFFGKGRFIVSRSPQLDFQVCPVRGLRSHSFRIILSDGSHEKENFMRKRRLIALSIACAVVATALLISTRLTPAQSGGARAQEPPPPFYNPYPPGILPADLPQEIERVRREVRFIENEAIAQWRALPPPTLTGQPPILAHTGQRANVLLGKLMNFDENISPFKNRACGFCHMPYAGFSGW